MLSILKEKDDTIPNNPGLLEQSLDPRDCWIDEVLGGSEIDLPEAYKIEGLTFEPQGSHPYCVSFCVTKMLEYKYKQKGAEFAFSQPHLFYNSNGGYLGSYFRTNLAVAKDFGCVDEPKLPMPANIWEFDQFIYDNLKTVAQNIPFHDPKKIGGYARVSTLSSELKKAIMQHGPLLVGVYAGGGYWNPDTKRQGSKDNHAVLLVGWNQDHWILFDSLQPKAGFDGYHTVSKDYTFNSAYAIVELPADWKEKRDKARSEGFEHCLNHYGQPRDFEKEVRVAAQMQADLKGFNNQSVYEAAGRFWTVLVNMASYGGYNTKYTKWGKEYPGDIWNFIYHWRRTGQLIFDPNKLRSEYN
jgi:hypothetical protein